MEAKDGYLHFTKQEAVEIKWFSKISLLGNDPDASQFIKEVHEAYSYAKVTDSDVIRVINKPESRHFLAKRILNLQLNEIK